MTYFTNTSNKDITYRGMTIRPMESILLDDHGFPTKGEVFYTEEKLLALDDSIAEASKKAKEDLGDLDDRIEKKVTSLTGDLVTAITNITGDVENLNKYTSGMASDIEAAQEASKTANENADRANSELKNKVTLADVNTRLQEVEDKTRTLITSCTSQKKKTYDAAYPFANAISCTNFINFFTCNSCTCKVFECNVPLKCLISDIEPGLYVGNVLDTVNCCDRFCAGTDYQNVRAYGCVTFPGSQQWGSPVALTYINSDSIDNAYVYMCVCINKCVTSPKCACCLSGGKYVCTDYTTYAKKWAADFWNNVMKKKITSNTIQLQ